MKKEKILLKNCSWAGYVTGNAFKAIDDFFAFAHLDYYKQNLSEAVILSYKKNIYKENNPSDAFVFYTALNFFTKVCYCLQGKSKKWKLKESLRCEKVFHLSSLTKEEYENPFIVFQKAFDEITLEKFEFFLSQILEHSLSPLFGEPESDLATPYIYFIKMLDAAELIRERELKKLKRRLRLIQNNIIV